MGAKAPPAYSLDGTVEIQAPHLPPVGADLRNGVPLSGNRRSKGPGGAGSPLEKSGRLPYREGPEQQPINSPKASFFEVGFPKDRGRVGSVFRSLGTPTALPCPAV